MSEKITVHVHDNNRAPQTQNCVAKHELTTANVLTMHYHPGACQLCPNGHCHQGTISLTLNERGEIYISLEQIPPPGKVTIAPYNPHDFTDEAH